MSTAPARLEELFGGPLTGPCRDPHSVYRRLRREAPVLPIEMGPETGYFVSRYEEVKEVLRNDELFSNHSNAKGVSLVMGRTIPQIEYTWSARPIGYVKDFGGGVTLGGNWSIYFESHRWSFRDKIAITGDGPYGFHNIVIVRKTFDLTF